MLPQKAKHLDKRPAPEEGAWGRKAVRQEEVLQQDQCFTWVLWQSCAVT
jgi:hypothetical protein